MFSAIKNVVSGVFGGADAATDAAGAQQAGIAVGLNAARAQNTLAREDIRPFREAGLSALTRQQEILGLLGDERQRLALEGIQESPGQKFLRERSERTLARNASAIGGLGGGNVRQALAEQGVNIANAQLGEYQNRLAGLAGMGSGAAQQSAGLAQDMGRMLLSGQAGMGQSRAQGILGAQQANAALAEMAVGAGLGAAAGGGLFGGTAGTATTLGTGAQGAFGGSAGAGALIGLLSDKNMKEDVRDLDLKECFDIINEMDLKSWKYIEEAGIDRKTHLGPMAQDAPKCIKIPQKEMLNLHDELMLIAGALQYAKEKGLVLNLREGM